MSVLTPKQLGMVRRRVAEALEYDIDTTGWTAPQINGAIQFLEDWYEGERSVLNAGLNAATSPTTLPLRVKKAMVIEFLKLKLKREVSP